MIHILPHDMILAAPKTKTEQVNMYEKSKDPKCKIIL